MQASARNTFLGKITALSSGAVNDDVVVTLEGGQQVVATICKVAAENMGLEIGRAAYVVLKASNMIILADAAQHKLSTPNQFTGKIRKLTRGFVNGEVVLELPGGAQITAIITLDGVNRLRLEEGSEVTAVINPCNVLVAVDK